MNDIIKLLIAIILSLGALLIEILLDRFDDSSWLIVIIKTVVAFVLIVALGLAIKFILVCLNVI